MESLFIQSFKNALKSDGFEPPEKILADGEFHQFTQQGDFENNQNSFYLLYPDKIYFGIYGYCGADCSIEVCSENLRLLDKEERVALNIIIKYRCNQELKKEIISNIDCLKLRSITIQ